MKKRIKINGIIIFFVFWLIAFFPKIFFRSTNIISFSFDQTIEIFGIALILLGQIIRVSSRGHKSEYSRSGHSLIQSGPYSLVRNPMYLGIFLIGIGIVFMLFNLWALCIFIIFFVVRYLLLIFQEEKKLKEAFPVEYKDYHLRVPRILPSLGDLFKKDIREYLPLKFAWIKKEIVPISLVLLLTFLIESFEDIKEKGGIIYLREMAAYLIVIVLLVIFVSCLSKRTTAG